MKKKIWSAEGNSLGSTTAFAGMFPPKKWQQKPPIKLQKFPVTTQEDLLKPPKFSRIEGEFRKNEHLQ